MGSDSTSFQRNGDVTTLEGDAAILRAEGAFVRPNFLSPFVLVRLLDALERLSPAWAPSERMGLLGRGGTEQVRPTNLAVQAALDEIRHALAPAALQWARSCGFRLPAAPLLQLFPVRMVGDADAPARQEPHTDSHGEPPRTPICTNVFYAKAKAIQGGDLALAAANGDLSAPRLVRPRPNMMVSIPGDRVHWVEPLHAGERVSVVINFY